MAKVAMTCPFSNRICRDCAVYRGSHYYLCFKKEYRGCLVGEGGKAGKEKTVYGVRNFTVDVPSEVLSSRNVITDVEDMIETEEFEKFGVR
ncbi:MAG TPA: hypothetical protein VMT62_09070 [Syntrophorhabdaceae bacterium]|nr:hypothetical protein [Syntrophorhabdaceae bacterium]